MFSTILKHLFLPALGGLLDLVYPPRCLLCGKFRPAREIEAGIGFCLECRAAFQPLPPGHCSICAQPFTSPLEAQHLCHRCLKKRPLYDQIFAAGLYEGPLREAIHAFKYRRRIELAHPLAAFMAELLGGPFRPPEADLILPVPLHGRRLRQRGFNQALLLARTLYRPWKALIRYDILKRTRFTASQMSLPRADRKANVRQAFALTRPEAVRDRRIMLIDDVFTTGATINECARVLKKAGAAGVRAVTLARVP